MIVERNYDGAWVVYASDSMGQLIVRRYYGYAKAEAVSMFKRELKDLEAVNA